MSLLLVLVLAVGVSAQTAKAVSYTVGVWSTSGVPGLVSEIEYPLDSVRCGQPKQPSAPAPIVNPQEARFDDPADVTLDCLINITVQVAKLDPAVGLRAAFRANTALRATTAADGAGVYGDLTVPFERRLGPPNPPAHPRLR